MSHALCVVAGSIAMFLILYFTVLKDYRRLKSEEDLREIWEDWR